MGEQIITDSAAALDLYIRKNRASVPKTLSFFNEDNTDYSLSGLTFQLNVKEFEYSSSNLFQLTSGFGLTISGNDITFEITAVQSLLATKEIYWWELKETTTNRTWLGKMGAYFYYGDPKELTDTEDVTIKLSADVVRVTISTGGITTITSIDGGTL
jgi:hypothetical protein